MTIATGTNAAPWLTGITDRRQAVVSTLAKGILRGS